MTVKTLIEKLSHYNKDAIVRLHHREGAKQLWEINIPVAKENQEKMVFEWKELAKKYHCDFLGFDMICNRVEIDIGWENGFPECDILNQIIKDIEKQRGES